MNEYKYFVGIMYPPLHGGYTQIRGTRNYKKIFGRYLVDGFVYDEEEQVFDNYDDAFKHASSFSYPVKKSLDKAS